MKTKTIGLILTLIGGIGEAAIVLLMNVFPICCEVGMEFYHTMLQALSPVFIVVLFLGVYLFFRPEKKVKIIKTRITKILTEDEKKVVSALKKGEKTQAQLRRELDFSKAKLSVLLEKMQKRGLIKKVKRGRTNIVILKKF